MIKFKINDQEVQAKDGETILQVAKRYNIDIPTLCHHDLLDPAGLCRVCTVELFDGRRTKFVTACNYPVWEGMEIFTETEKVKKGRQMVIELIAARCPDSPALTELNERYGIRPHGFSEGKSKCVVCGMCVRVCDEYSTSALSLSNRSDEIKVETPFGLLSDVCTGCGACASLCPADIIELKEEDGFRYLYIEGEKLAKVKMKQCNVCGEHFCTEAIMDQVKKKMKDDYVALHDQSCPSCTRKLMAEAMAESYV